MYPCILGDDGSGRVNAEPQDRHARGAGRGTVPHELHPGGPVPQRDFVLVFKTNDFPKAIEKGRGAENFRGGRRCIPAA